MLKLKENLQAVFASVLSEQTHRPEAGRNPLWVELGRQGVTSRSGKKGRSSFTAALYGP